MNMLSKVQSNQTNFTSVVRFPAHYAAELNNKNRTTVLKQLEKLVNNGNDDKVVITIGGHGRENPFKPFYDQAFSGDFPPPDDVFNIDESAKKLMSIKVAGILYDPYRPSNASAIVNASGSDYMVKKGDVVAGFSILDINKNRVYVKFGSNTYNAGIGETIHAELKDNSGLDNIDKKFAGNTR